MPDDGFILLGDALWLDFVNSARGRGPAPADRIPDLASFARWCRAQSLDPATAAIEDAHELRDRLITLAEALHAGCHPPGGAIASINRLLVHAGGCQQLTRVNGDWHLRFSPQRPLVALEAIARSAAATLVVPDLMVRRCAGDHCSLFFTDTTPTGHRRWCDMTVCGKQVRVERRRGVRR